jgi:chromosome partitioning protein
LLTLNALVAAKEVLIPIQTEYYALEGLGQLMNNVNLVKKQLNPDLEVATIVLTMFDSRTNLSQQVAEEVRKHFGDIVITTEIPRAVRVSEAPSFQQTVITYDPGSPGAQAYVKVAKEFAQRHAGVN